MKIRISLLLLSVLLISACGQGSKTAITDDTVVRNKVDGVTLIHRAIISPPTKFQSINQPYRSLYTTSIMSKPSYEGKILGKLENAHPYFVLGSVDNKWLAITTKSGGQLIGYVHENAGVAESRYKEVVRQDRSRRAYTNNHTKTNQKAKVSTKAKTNTKTNVKPQKSAGNCVTVGGNSKACKDAKSDTWIIE